MVNGECFIGTTDNSLLAKLIGDQNVQVSDTIGVDKRSKVGNKNKMRNSINIA